MKKCYHIFESDGGQCIKCRKTASELLEEKRDDLIMKLTPSQIEKQDKKALKAGFFDWNVLTLDQMVEYLEEKHK